MDDETRWTLNAPQVVDETIDGEVMIIHLVTGHYYSLLDVGANVWQRLRAGQAQREIVDGIACGFTGEYSVISDSVIQFLAQLQQEDLVRPLDADAAATEAVIEESTAAVPPPFLPPVLNKYLDMQQLLALDPIHETDERGWPHAKAE